MQSLFLFICLAAVCFSAADVSHLKSTYSPEGSASNQHEVIAPVIIVGEPARFVSYALPDASIGEASNQISAVIPAPAHDYETAVENYHYESAPSNSISFSAPAPKNFEKSDLHFEAAPSDSFNYFVPAPDKAELFSHHSGLQNFEAAPSNQIRYAAPAPQHTFPDAPVAAPSISVYSFSASLPASDSLLEAQKVEDASEIDTLYAANGGYVYEPKLKRSANLFDF